MAVGSMLAVEEAEAQSNKKYIHREVKEVDARKIYECADKPVFVVVSSSLEVKTQIRLMNFREECIKPLSYQGSDCGMRVVRHLYRIYLSRENKDSAAFSILTFVVVVKAALEEIRSFIYQLSLW